VIDEDEETIRIEKEPKQKEEQKQESVLPLQDANVTSNLDILLTKGNRIDLLTMQGLDIRMDLARKEVKNKSLVNFISSYEDRYLSIVQIGNELYVVVFKKYNATVVETKKKLTSAANLIKGQIQNAIKEYKQTDSIANKD
jgi:hypothetical protein